MTPPALPRYRWNLTELSRNLPLWVAGFRPATLVWFCNGAPSSWSFFLSKLQLNNGTFSARVINNCGGTELRSFFSSVTFCWPWRSVACCFISSAVGQWWMDLTSPFPEDEQICIQAASSDTCAVAAGTSFGQQVAAQHSTGRNHRRKGAWSL